MTLEDFFNVFNGNYSEVIVYDSPDKPYYAYEELSKFLYDSGIVANHIIYGFLYKRKVKSIRIDYIYDIRTDNNYPEIVIELLEE